MKKCADCGITKFLTKHHTEQGEIWLCQDCHCKQHGIIRSEESLQRIVKRAKRRIKLEERRIAEAEFQIERLRQ